MQIGLPGEAICSREGQLCPARERANECAGRVMGNNTAPQHEQCRARPAASDGAAREAPCGQGHGQGCGPAVAAFQALWASERKQGEASLERSTRKKVAPAAGFVPWTLTGTRVLGGRGWAFGGTGGAKRGLEGTTAPPQPKASCSACTCTQDLLDFLAVTPGQLAPRTQRGQQAGVLALPRPAGPSPSGAARALLSPGGRGKGGQRLGPT